MAEIIQPHAEYPAVNLSVQTSPDTHRRPESSRLSMRGLPVNEAATLYIV
jgi:hypothetical protein